MKIGISKRELFEDYYLDEIAEVMHEYSLLHSPQTGETVKQAYADDFFGF